MGFLKRMQKNAHDRLEKTPEGRRQLAKIENKKKLRSSMQNGYSGVTAHSTKKQINKGIEAFNLHKPLFHKQDGNVHLIEIGGVEPANNESGLMVDDTYTTQINSFLDSMRLNGYTITRINTTTRPVTNSHMTNITNGWTRYNTEIQYK